MDYLQNNHDLLHARGYEKQRRTYFGGKTSKGTLVIRGSVRKYTHAVTWELEPRDKNNTTIPPYYRTNWQAGEIIPASFQSRKELAEKQFKFLTNQYAKSDTYKYVGEIVELTELSAKEVRNLKRMSKAISLVREKLGGEVL